jgi:hypothetical protein
MKPIQQTLDTALEKLEAAGPESPLTRNRSQWERIARDKHTPQGKSLYDHLWSRLAQMYGRRLWIEYGETMPQLWRDELATFTPHEVGLATKELMRHPVTRLITLPELIALTATRIKYDRANVTHQTPKLSSPRTDYDQGAEILKRMKTAVRSSNTGEQLDALTQDIKKMAKDKVHE